MQLQPSIALTILHELMNSLSVATAHTLAFLRRFLPPAPAVLLEVGAGNGELARALLSAGYHVTAIDIDAAAVDALRGAGVDAVNVAWLDYVGSPVDAVVFSRSLHHLPVELAVQHANALLRPAGSILVEEFAFADAPPAALDWLRRQLEQAAQNEQWQPPSTGFLADVLHSRTNPQSHAGHDIASADTMRAALGAAGFFVHEDAVPYFYRYFAQYDGTASSALIRQVLAAETEAIETGILWPLGRRWVVRRSG